MQKKAEPAARRPAANDHAKELKRLKAAEARKRKREEMEHTKEQASICGEFKRGLYQLGLMHAKDQDAYQAAAREFFFQTDGTVPEDGVADTEDEGEAQVVEQLD